MCVVVRSVRPPGVAWSLPPVFREGYEADPEGPEPHPEELPQGVGQDHQTVRHGILVYSPLLTSK